jgi:hypothetical protein
MFTRNYSLFTRLHDFYCFSKCTTDATLIFAFVPSKNLTFQNLSSYFNFRQQDLGNENLVLALFILCIFHCGDMIRDQVRILYP